MIYLLILIAFVISIIFSMLIIPRILIVALTKRLFDIPDERKIHTGAVPRLGGISFAPIILFTLAFISAISYLGYLQGLPIPPNIISHVTPDFYLLTCGLILLYLAGIKDDLIGYIIPPNLSYRYWRLHYYLYPGYGSITCMDYSVCMNCRHGWVCR